MNAFSSHRSSKVTRCKRKMLPARLTIWESKSWTWTRQWKISPTILNLTLTISWICLPVRFPTSCKIAARREKACFIIWSFVGSKLCRRRERKGRQLLRRFKSKPTRWRKILSTKFRLSYPTSKESSLTYSCQQSLCLRHKSESQKSVFKRIWTDFKAFTQV